MRELLILKPSSLGDIIHALLIAGAIREQRPDVRISWVARDIFVPLVAQSAAVDAVIPFRRNAGIRGFLHLVKTLRQQRYDAVLEMQGLARTALLMAAARADAKWTRADGREGARWLSGKRIAMAPGSAGAPPHAVDILRRFLPALGLADCLPAHLRFRPRPWPADLPESPGLLLFPGSRRAEKEWPGFSVLTHSLTAAYPDMPVIWLGSEILPDPFAVGGVPANFINYTGRSDLASLPAVMASARLVVANDSGPMHLAAALAVDVLALFGPTDPRRYGPYPPAAAGHHVLAAEDGNLAALKADAVLRRIQSILIRRKPDPIPFPRQV